MIAEEAEAYGEAANGASNPTRLLALCPRCSYSLNGLPIRHSCPECGMPFDRTCKVYRRSARLYIVLGVLSFGMLFLMLAYWSFGSGNVVQLGFSVAFGMIACKSVCRACRAKGMVIVSADEVRIIDPRRSDRLIPCQMISTIEWDTVFGDVVIRERNKETPVRIHRSLLDSNRTARALVSEIRLHLAE